MAARDASRHLKEPPAPPSTADRNPFGGSLLPSLLNKSRTSAPDDRAKLEKSVDPNIRDLLQHQLKRQDDRKPSPRWKVHHSKEAFPTSGERSLHEAVASGCEKKVRELLANGAAVNAVSSRCNTPLHIAAESLGEDRSSACILAMLVSAGANVNAVNAMGYTPYELCKKTGPCSARDLLKTQLC